MYVDDISVCSSVHYGAIAIKTSSVLRCYSYAYAILLAWECLLFVKCIFLLIVRCQCVCIGLSGVAGVSWFCGEGQALKSHRLTKSRMYEI